MVAVVEFGCQVSWEYKRGKLEVMWDWWFFQWFQKKERECVYPKTGDKHTGVVQNFGRFFASDF